MAQLGAVTESVALAQTGIDEKLASIADYLVQLDDLEFSQLNTEIYKQAI